MSTTTNLQFLQTNLLDDAGTAVWSAAELYDTMEVETQPFSAVLGRVGATATYFESDKTFWLQAGTAQGEAPICEIYRAGTLLGTGAYTLDYLNGRVALATV